MTQNTIDIKFKIGIIISYMRSGSTLLQHIINQDSTICAYREYHHKFLTKSPKELYIDFITNIKVDNPNASFYFDKDLHRAPISILKSFPEAFYIILLRKPFDSILSACKRAHFRKKTYSRYSPHLLKKTINYYERRLAEIYEFTILNPKNLLILDYRDLIYDSNNILRKITKYLGLKKALLKEYPIHKNSGKWYKGDGSPKIMTGFIEKIDTNYEWYNQKIGERIIIEIEEAVKRANISHINGLYWKIKEYK